MPGIRPCWWGLAALLPGVLLLPDPAQGGRLGLAGQEGCRPAPGNGLGRASAAQAFFWAEPWGGPGFSPVPGDYDGDSQADLAVYDQASGLWYVRSASGPVLTWAEPWGGPGLSPVPGDYDGDDRADLAVYDQVAGRWYIRTSTNTILVWAEPWGGPGLEPVPGDYDADGRDDLAVYDAPSGCWYIRTPEASEGFQVLAWGVVWGGPGLTPAGGDFDGDGSADLAVYDETSGRWYVRSVAGTLVAWAVFWGGLGLEPACGPYRGRAASDLAVFDQDNGDWYVRAVSGTQTLAAVTWGWAGATPAGGDYDGDGAWDLGVYDGSAGVWYATAAPWSGSAPSFSILHGVYPGGRTGEEDDLTPADLQAYEWAAGKTAAWVYFSHNWYRSRAFPAETCAWIREAGRIPFVRLMLRSSAVLDQAEPVFTLDRIIAGEFDADLRAWASAALAFGGPLMAEYGTEVNGSWFSWNGIWNGGGATAGYGDPTEPDGPERFRDAFRHIVAVCRGQGATNVAWVFHVNHQDWPQEGWNRLETYYPGDAWVDWLGVSVYGALTPLEDAWPEFRPLMDAVYPRLCALAPGKPVGLLEFGAAAGHPLGDQAAWARSALSDLVSGRWARLGAFSWWNENWQNDEDPAHDTDMRVQANPALTAVFQRWVGLRPGVASRLSSRPAPGVCGPVRSFP